ncbi:MAG TPA: hypothetical protein VHD76_14705 [Bryobacteraceae bacterium]|nr:hypothetical protein [Bryobacteraceae bacterium]
MRHAQVTTPAAEHGAEVLRAKGKAGGGKAESSVSEPRLDWACNMGKPRGEVSPTETGIGPSIRRRAVCATSLVAASIPVASYCGPVDRRRWAR